MMSGELNARKLLYLNSENTFPRYGSSRDMPLCIERQPFLNLHIYKHYIQEQHHACVVLGFRYEVDKNCAPTDYYEASSGNFLATFRDKGSIHISFPCTNPKFVRRKFCNHNAPPPTLSLSLSLSLFQLMPLMCRRNSSPQFYLKRTECENAQNLWYHFMVTSVRTVI